jgi:hypothetical protein
MDPAASGTTLGRPELRKLIADCHAGKIAQRVDRRSLADGFAMKPTSRAAMSGGWAVKADGGVRGITLANKGHDTWAIQGWLVIGRSREDRSKRAWSMANNTGLDEADVEPGDLRTRRCQNATGLWSHHLSNSGY